MILFSFLKYKLPICSCPGIGFSVVFLGKKKAYCDNSIPLNEKSRTIHSFPTKGEEL